jgi:hypothetical protein
VGFIKYIETRYRPKSGGVWGIFMYSYKSPAPRLLYRWDCLQALSHSPNSKSPNSKLEISNTAPPSQISYKYTPPTLNNHHTHTSPPHTPHSCSAVYNPHTTHAHNIYYYCSFELLVGYLLFCTISLVSLSPSERYGLWKGEYLTAPPSFESFRCV